MLAIIRRAALVLFFSILCIAYLHPGLDPVFEGDRSHVLSDGTDGVTWPYIYGVVLEHWHTRPAYLLYGAVPGHHLNAPEGMALWMPWIEKWTAVMAAPFVPLEHLSTVVVALLMIFNALCMYALCRHLGWSRSLSLALAIAWAFTPFTRARAQVHGAFASTYHIPLFMLGVLLAFRATRVSNLLLSALCFVLLAMAPHYFVITLAFISPLLILVCFLASRPLDSALRGISRLMFAMVPMLALLFWCFFQPLPKPFMQQGAMAKPPSGEMPDGSIHPFLHRFAASPLDYFTGDIALGDKDWNPLRGTLTESVLSRLNNSNPHERANGVRWVIWLLAIGAFVVRPYQARAFLYGVGVFGVFAFWLSLSPELTEPILGPAYWLYSLVSQIRVPSRAGILVHFALLLSAGIFIHYSRWPKTLKWSWLLPVLILIDFPPAMQHMRISEVRPALHSLIGKDCGAGLYFPYVSGDRGILENYYFLQEMRGSRCKILNVQWPNARNYRFHQIMGISGARLDAFNAFKPDSIRGVEHLVRCAGLSWIVFDPRTNFVARTDLCRTLGFTMTSNRVCEKRGSHSPLTRPPEECL